MNRSLNGNISKNIPLNAYDVIDALKERQNLPWKNARINDNNKAFILQELFKIINSSIPKEDFMYQCIFQQNSTTVPKGRHAIPL